MPIKITTKGTDRMIHQLERWREQVRQAAEKIEAAVNEPCEQLWQRYKDEEQQAVDEWQNTIDVEYREVIPDERRIE